MVKTKSSKLNKQDRRMLAQQIINTGNIAAGALLFQQAFSDKPFSFSLAILGTLLLSLAYVWATGLMKGGDDK